MVPSNPELSRTRIESARKGIAEIISKLETHTNEVTWACESEDWNDEIVYCMKSATEQLAYALAALTTWFDDAEEDTDKEDSEPT